MEEIKPTASTDNVEPSNAPRKRRNRWGEPQESTNDISTTTSSSVPDNQETKDEKGTDGGNPENNEESAKKARKSRWASSENIPKAALLPGMTGLIAPLSEEVVQQTVILKLQLAQVSQKLLTVTQDALLIEQDPNRSPSPPPKYDSSGKRTNTREVRMRESLNNQRIKIIEELMKLNPTFIPPADFIKAKPFRKIYIPKNNDPTCNYIGLIIGPRGNTQKQMEQETQCKISIRGKGSAKEGSKGRQTKQVDEDDELHVHIQGDYEENVDRAARMIDAILRPLDDRLNEHKQKQLRELALINGTFKEDDYCPICGEKGHRQFDCPYRAKSFKAAGVKCAICGDLSHPTRDCPKREQGPTNEKNLDSEYDNFLAELEGGGGKDGDEGKGKEGGGGAGGSNIPPPPKKGHGPVVLQPIVDVVSRNPAMMNMTTSTTNPTSTVPPVATVVPTATAAVAPTTSYDAMSAMAWSTAGVTTTAPATTAYNPYAAYQSYDYSALLAAAAAAGYDPAVYAAYLAAYNPYAAATGAAYPGMQQQPPPPPPSNP